MKRSVRPRVSKHEYFVLKAGGKPSTWLPPEGLVEQVFSIFLFFLVFFIFFQKLKIVSSMARIDLAQQAIDWGRT